MLQFGIEEGRVELDKRAIVQREPEADPLYRCSDASKRGVGWGIPVTRVSEGFVGLVLN